MTIAVHLDAMPTMTIIACQNAEMMFVKVWLEKPTTIAEKIVQIKKIKNAYS
jgi:hypothetical protein